MRRSLALAALALLVMSLGVWAVTVTDAYNAPNPLVTETTFYLVYYPTPHAFESIVVKIYNQAAQQVDQPYAVDSDSVDWDGTDYSGNDLANGMYYYRVYVYDLVQGVPTLIFQSSLKTLAISR